MKRLITLLIAFAVILTLSSCEMLKGEQGEQGMTGAQGMPGEKGEQGEPGNTPYIGENGNWWIAGEDTGYPAQGQQGEQGMTGAQGMPGEKGEQGEPGNTPYIGENGNWWIADEDTGVSASGNSEPMECAHFWNSATLVEHKDGREGVIIRVCEDCGFAELSTLEHEYDNCRDANCDACGYVRVPEDHLYDGLEDNICNKCGYERGSYSEGLEFASNGDDTCYVSGIGTCSDTDIIIPPTSPDGKKVTSIGFHAFNECDNITSVELSNSITSISFCAFQFCSSLKSVIISDSVTSIDNTAFNYCYSLSELKVSEGNTTFSSIDGNLYSADGQTLIMYACGKQETEFSIPDGVVTIGERAFKGNNVLLSVKISDGVVVIEDYSFYECINLSKVVFTDNSRLTMIGEYAFRYCYSLKSITIPDSVGTICSNALDSSLEEINVSENNEFYKNMDGHLYSKDGKTLIKYVSGKDETTFVIPNGVTEIGDYALFYCDRLTGIVIPDSVTAIGDWSFGYCTALSSIDIPENVTQIGDAAFYYCINLTNIKIPSGVTKISSEMFVWCEALNSIEIPDSVIEIEPDAFNDTGYYKDANNWVNDVLYIGNHLIKAKVTVSGDYTIISGTVSIAKFAFYYCASLNNIEIPNSVIAIGDAAFYGCTSLNNVTFGENSQLIAIPSSAFWGCSSLAEIRIPDGVTSIGPDSFRECTVLTTIILPNSIEKIETSAFFEYNADTIIYYAGTEEEWSLVSIADFNYGIGSATIHYNHVI